MGLRNTTQEGTTFEPLGREFHLVNARVFERATVGDFMSVVIQYTIYRARLKGTPKTAITALPTW